MNVGVPGGIPNRSTIFVNVLTTANTAYKCQGNGVADDSTAIQNALNDCPANQVVYLPAGTYRMNSSVRTNKSYTTLRGAGQGKTVIMPYVNGVYAPINFGTVDYPRPPAGAAITAGAIAGSTTITVTDTSAVGVGKLIRIDPVNPTWVHNFNGEKANPTMSFVFRATAKTSNTVTFTPALPVNLSTYSPKMAVYSASLIEGFGIEDLTINLINTTDAAALFCESSWACWIKNIEVANSNARTLFLSHFNAGEIRHCYTHGTRSGGPGHEGIDLYGDSCWNLIEDNIVNNGGFPGIVLGDWRGGCQGNVIAYNYGMGVLSNSSDTAGADISFAHGPHNVYNLAEGNVVSMIQADGYWGSSSNNTIYRNWVTVTHPTATQGMRAIDLTHCNDYYTVVGNVLGTPAFAGQYDTEVNAFNNGIKTIFRLGYPYMGNTGYSGIWPVTSPPNYSTMSYILASSDPTVKVASEFDPNVKATLFRANNYDYAHKSIADAVTGNMPASLFRSTKPNWFGNRAWPPVDPSKPGTLTLDAIPAGYRFVHGTEPPSATNVAPVASAQSVTTTANMSKTLTLVATDANGDALTYAIVANPMHGSLTGSGASRTYIPASGFTGTDSFTFKANDGTQDSNVATVSITVAAIVNHAPVANAQTISTVEDTAKTIQLMATDADANLLTYMIIANPAHGSLSGTGASRTYTPAANYIGTDSFTFKVNDGTIDSNVATVSVTVTAVNDAPVATAQTVATSQNTAKAITLAGADIEGGTLTYAIVANPMHGTLSGTGAVRTYTPTSGYVGADSFTFTVSDGSLTSTAATVSISVVAPPALIGADIGAVGLAGSTIYAGGVYTLKGAGSDIWNTADAFQFAWRSVVGDVRVTARVTSQTRSDPWAKAGVMIRESAAVGSRHAFTCLTPNNGLAYQRRLVANGSSNHTAGPLVIAPYWVRLERVGTTVISSYSANGVNWTEIRRETIAMGTAVQVGLAVTAHTTQTLSTATFTDVEIISATATSN